jgi:hypothetical protein
MGLLDDAIREHLDLKRQRGADPGEIERLEREALGPVRREPTARMGAVPQLEVQPPPVSHFEPATELLQPAEPAPKRGFLRRSKSAAETEASDFADHLDEGMHRESGLSHDDQFADDDGFDDHDDPFAPDAQVGDADPSGYEDPATQEHAGGVLAAEPPLAAEPQAPAPAVEPAAEAEPPHLIFDSAPPPRPKFAPAPPSVAEPEPEPAPVDEVELEPEVDEHPTTVLETAPPAAPAPAEPARDERARADAAHETREWSVEEAFAAEDDGGIAPPPDPLEEDVLEETPEFLQDTPDHDRLWFEQRPPRDFDFDG